jgi:1-deoxy-D-xylulose-5-phosphate reductoisomerase
METPAKRLNLADIGRLDFEAPDVKRFPALRLAREALEAGGAAPIVLNAANEVAVASFLAGDVRFPHIAGVVEEALSDAAKLVAPRSIDEVMEIDRVTRRQVEAMMKASCH